MRIFQYIFTLIILMLTIAEAKAQSGASGNKGTYLNYDEYVNSPRAAGGDVDIDTKGTLQIGVNGRYDIVGALTNNGTITLDSGAVLTIFGNMYNYGTIVLKKGATLIFQGKNWLNSATAKVTDGNGINTIPGGDLIFDTYRPLVDGSWLVATPALSAYGGICLQQLMDGGNVPMDVNWRLINPFDIQLVNSNTKIEGSIDYSLDHSHIVIGDHDLVLTKNAKQFGFGPNKYAVTDGAGHVVKENYLGKWIFPVGKDTNDYTPAQIENLTTNTMHVAVQDYASSISIENTSTSKMDGIDRTWNIFADIPTGISSITLQHNSTSNQEDFSESFNFVTRYGLTPNMSGDKSSTTAWQKNYGNPSLVGDLSTSGVVAGASVNTKSFDNFATNAYDSIAFFTKSTDAFSNAATNIFELTALAENCESKINFKTLSESNVNKFQLQHSVDGITFTTVATFLAKGTNSEYDFQHLTAVTGANYYRVVVVDESGNYTVSKVVTVTVDCSRDFTPIVLYPNPAKDFIKISGLGGTSEIRIINMHGRVVSAVSTTNAIETIDISGLPAATYVAQILEGTQKITSVKFVKL